MSKFDPIKKYWYHDMVNSAENILSMWDFFCDKKNPIEDDPDIEDKDQFCRDTYGVWTDEDGDEYVITDIGMQQVCEMLAFIKQTKRDYELSDRGLRGEINDLKRKLVQAKQYASMSDERIADELQKEIDHYNKEAGEEGLIYGPVELMEYCRDRLRNTRTK